MNGEEYGPWETETTYGDADQMSTTCDEPLPPAHGQDWEPYCGGVIVVNQGETFRRWTGWRRRDVRGPSKW